MNVQHSKARRNPDQIARGVWNKAAIATSMNDADAALEVCHDLAAIEDCYELRLRTDRSTPAPTSGAKFRGKPINSQYDGTCKVCSRPYKAGQDVLWARGAGAAHLECGEIAE